MAARGPSAPSHLFRSSSETAQLSNHNFSRLRQTTDFVVHQPGAVQADAGAPSIAMTSHLASQRYVEQHRAFVEHQRQLHDEERNLWQVEREELHGRIQELEQMVRQLGGQVDPSFRPAEPQQAHRGSSVSIYSPDHLSRVSSNTSTGEEFWRGTGGKNSAHASRAFSEPSSRPLAATTNNANQLPPISEAPDHPPRKKSVGFDMAHTNVIGQDFHVHPIPTIAHSQAKGSLDGITFKPSVLTNGAVESYTTSQSASPMQTPMVSDKATEPAPSSEAREAKPQILNLPASGLTASALLVKDAGHTPLARISDSAGSISGQASPQVPAAPAALATQKPAAEERRTRPPNERADSYFPVVEDENEPPMAEGHVNGNGEQIQYKDLAEDPALIGPLGLSSESDTKANQGFLDQLNSKLLEAQAQEAADEASTASPVHHELTQRSEPLDQPPDNEAAIGNEESEPKLKIKRSMNFGSVFGASTVGRDV